MIADLDMANTPKALEAIILAAGKGTRMQSDLPKVCHPVGDRPMVCAVVDACLRAGCSRVVVVVGYKQELVREALEEYGDKVEFAIQHEQLGTGHAVVSAMDSYPIETRENTDVFVLCGDGPLIRSSTLDKMLDVHHSSGAHATLATSVIDDPDGYGRIVRNGDGRFERIIEQKNANEQELAINEVNPSYYCMNALAMFEALKQVNRNELTGEYYITDVFELMLKNEQQVEVIDAVPSEDILSINTLDHLAQVDSIFRARNTQDASREGSAGSETE